ncbi:hypothetical protein GW750_02950 [bacterium]|nr:hypothetical protein [bacterium]
MEDLNIKKIKDRVCREDKLSKTLLQKNKELKDIFIISDEERCLHLIDILSSY